MSSPQIKHEEASLVINKNDNFEYQHTIDYLGENGYIRVSNVRETGEFSVKGDVIDIFPSGYDNPVRVDTFGNEIEKLQIFNLKDQKPIDDIKRLIVYPFNEFLFNRALFFMVSLCFYTKHIYFFIKLKPFGRVISF